MSSVPPVPEFSEAEVARRRTSGLLMGLGAYLSWGGIVIYFKAVDHVDPLTVTAWRLLASLPLVVGLALVTGGVARFRRLLANRAARNIMPVSAALIGINWLLFVYCIWTERVMQASLAYFLAPLMIVLLGVGLLGERLSRLQGVGLALATVGVGVMVFSSAEIPWLSLLVALTWSLYSLIRKTREIPAIEGLGVETALLALPALAWLMWAGFVPPTGDSPYGSVGVEVLVLALGGPVTAIPLILFGGAARRITLTTIGFLQYIAPTLQFLLAVLVYREPFGLPHAIAFGLIWAALGFYSVDTVVRVRRQRALAVPAVPPAPAIVNEPRP